MAPGNNEETGKKSRQGGGETTGLTLRERFGKLPDSVKVRAFFHPLALAATQSVSIAHYLFIPHRSYFTPMSVISGLILGGTIAATAEIVSRYVRKEEKIIREKEKILHYATNPLHTHLYVVEVMANGEIVYRFANETYSKRPNRAHFEDLFGVKYSDFHTPEESSAFYKEFEDVIKAGIPFESEYISRSGRISQRTLTPYIDNETGRQYVTVVSNDIGELKKLQQQLAEAAYHDSLTGLANRRLLEDRTRLAMADMVRDRREGGNLTFTALLKLDLDNFKYHNDTYGHPFGDQLLIEVARRLTGCVRTTDTVAREGGDEFTLLLPKTTMEGAVMVARKVIEEINRPYLINNNEGHMGVSVGLSFYPQDGKNFAELQKRADQALYWAKENGKNTYCMYDNIKNNILLTKGPSQ